MTWEAGKNKIDGAPLAGGNGWPRRACCPATRRSHVVFGPLAWTGAEDQKPVSWGPEPGRLRPRLPSPSGLRCPIVHLLTVYRRVLRTTIFLLAAAPPASSR